MSGNEIYWHSALAKRQNGKALTSPKDFLAAKSLKNFQLEERDKEVPAITHSRYRPAMAVTPEQTEPIEDLQKEGTPKTVSRPYEGKGKLSLWNQVYLSF